MAARVRRRCCGAGGAPGSLMDAIGMHPVASNLEGHVPPTCTGTRVHTHTFTRVRASSWVYSTHCLAPSLPPLSRPSAASPSRVPIWCGRLCVCGWVAREDGVGQLDLREWVLLRYGAGVRCSSSLWPIAGSRQPCPLSWLPVPPLPFINPHLSIFFPQSPSPAGGPCFSSLLFKDGTKRDGN